MAVNRDFRDLFAALNAAAFHAEPRFTRDLDVWTGATEDDAARVFDALRAFGVPLEGVTARAHLIQNKRAAGRPQDLLDLELLEKHGER